MALSSIQGQTSVGSSKPGNLSASIGIDITAPKNAPAGYSISVAGRRTDGIEAGTYCIVFGYTVPAGKAVDVQHSGSFYADGKGYDGMLVKVVDDSDQKSGTTDYWEVWFLESDVNGTGWSSEVKMDIGGNEHIWTLSKKRTGGEL